jgi:hypothetical protein
MKSYLLGALEALGHWAIAAAIVVFCLANALFITTVLIRRDRRLVDRWTGPWLAANLAAAALGAGAPLVTGMLRLVLGALPDLGTMAGRLPK